MLATFDWKHARDRMLLAPDVTYLNAGSFGPLSRGIFEITTSLRQQLAEEPTDFMLRKLPNLLWRAREQLAGFLGGEPRRLLFTASVSAAVSLVASSLAFTAPGELLLSDQEYLTIRWCWERVAERHGLTLRIFPIPATPSDPEEIVQAAVRAMGPQTRLVFFSHIVSSTGLILPARRICEEAQRRGIASVVDGAHAVASIALNLADIPCDFYVGSCHKWLLAPSGASFLYLGREREERLQPLTISWGHHGMQATSTADERDPFGSTPRLRRLECEGTRDICPWLALPEAIEFQKDFDGDGATAHRYGLADHARERFAALGNLTAATPQDRALGSAMVAFHLPPETDASLLQNELWERSGIEVACSDRSGQPILRVSPHFYNSISDIDHLAESLIKLMPGSVVPRSGAGGASRT